MEEPNCGRCKKPFASWENVANHIRTQHADIVEYYKCPFWPICRNNKHLNGLYQTISNLRVHLYKHHDRVKGAECMDLHIEKVYWRRKRKCLISFLSNFSVVSAFLLLFFNNILSIRYRC